MDEKQLFKERTNKLLDLSKKYFNYIIYLLLVLVIYISIKIRTSNLSKLKDNTTGDWTLGPDLDPFLFLRWAKYIVENGSLMFIDKMRAVPFGLETKSELILHPYMIAWFHNIISPFTKESINYSATIYPVFFFAITLIAFFLLVKEIFNNSLGNKKSSLVALISCFFLTVIPVLLPRTIAGIPEKESAAFFFMFIALYFFIKSYNSITLMKSLIFAFLAGLTTSMMALVWGGYTFVPIIIGSSVLICFFLGQINLNQYFAYSIWLFSSAILMSLFSTRYPLKAFALSFTTGFAFLIFLILSVYLIISRTTLKEYSLNKFKKHPPYLVALIVTIILVVVLSSIFISPTFMFEKLDQIYHTLIDPVRDRLGLTVAENKQPYFNEWVGNFGPSISGFPLILTLTLIGAVYLFYVMLKSLDKKDSRNLTISFIIFLACLIFSRYSSTSVLNGTNFISITIYSLGFLILGYFSLKTYYSYYQSNNFDLFKEINFNTIILFILFFLTLVATRGAVRLAMLLVIPASILISYMFVKCLDIVRKHNSSNSLKLIFSLLFIIGTIYAGYFFYLASMEIGQSYAPSQYTFQWQNAMAWTRENTPTTAVFAHWWDYGYWIQSIGERATVLDGGNYLPYWNHLMGRYALTGADNEKSLELLYSHNVTHFLIDSTDIGKYSAFSNIGSDENYDRYSWIPTFFKDDNQMQEKKNSKLVVYQGGVYSDEDIYYTENGTKQFFPAGKSIIAGIILEISNNNTILTNPICVIVYQNQQYRIPMKYIFYENNLIEFEKGISSGIFVYPLLKTSGESFSIINDGTALYLSNRTVNSQLARLYLYNEKNSNFKLVHSEDDLIVSYIKAQTQFSSEFVYLDTQGLKGPIKIWELNYPSNIKVNDEFLLLDFPNQNLANTK
jgi:asparagine N-glycosylation enzyme membrane subunit Stt3